MLSGVLHNAVFGRTNVYNGCVFPAHIERLFYDPRRYIHRCGNDDYLGPADLFHVADCVYESCAESFPFVFCICVHAGYASGESGFPQSQGQRAAYKSQSYYPYVVMMLFHRFFGG